MSPKDPDQLTVLDALGRDLLDSHDLSLRLRKPHAWCRARLDDLYRAGLLHRDTTLSLWRYRRLR